MTVQIDNAKLIQEYQHGDEKTKEALIRIAGPEIFRGNEISDVIRKKFEEACKYQGLDPDEVLHTGDNLNVEQQVSNAYTMLRILAKSKRDGWEPDWNDSSQYKYYPWFDYEAGVGFVVDGTRYADAYSGTGVGSRLCFPNREMAIEFAKENIELYRIILSN